MPWSVQNTLKGGRRRGLFRTAWRMGDAVVGSEHLEGWATPWSIQDTLEDG